MSTLRHLAYAKLADHRGGKRVYLQNQRLAACGFAGGTRYSVKIEGSMILLTATDAGERSVCSRRRNDQEIPVIDLSSQLVAQAFGDADRVRVIYRDRVIEIDLHHQEMAQRRREASLTAAVAQKHLRTGSLCTGVGVLDSALHAGLKRAGLEIETSWACELSGEYLDAGLTINPLLARTFTIEGSIDEIEESYLFPVHILVAGLPCTAASPSGRAKKGLVIPEEDPDAGHLVLAFLSIARRVNPAVIILENVPAYQNTASMAIIRTTLKRWGYRLDERILDGGTYSLEDRRRMCLIAVSSGLPESKIEEIASGDRPSTIAEIIDPSITPSSTRWRKFEHLDRKETSDVALGKGFRQQIVTPEATRVGTMGRGYQKGRSTEPRLQHPTDQSLSRLFTPGEHASIKGIPSHFVQGLSEKKLHEVLGQSVIWPAFEALGFGLGLAL